MTSEVVTLPDGTVLGRVESWVDDPDIFDSWVESETGTDDLLVNGADRDRAELALVNSFLVHQIREQETASPSDPGYGERNARIQLGFQMQKTITRKVLASETG